MPTLYGPWIGSGYGRARIECVYTTAPSGGGSLITANLYFASENRVSDVSNSWTIGGDLGSDSGRLDISHGSGGGRTFIGTVSRVRTADASVSCGVSGVNAVGQTVSATFTLDTGGIPPVINVMTYRSVDSSGFIADLVSWTANGTIDKTQVEYGRTTNATSIKTVSGAADITVTGLPGGTQFYFRMRLSNTIAGYGPWTGWMSVTTSVDPPGMPNASWSIRNISYNSAETYGCSVADNGGGAITSYEVQYNTSKSATGAVSKSAASNPAMTGLLPGTTYYARIRARNSKGWGQYTDWKQFKTLTGALVRVGGVWKIAEPYVKWNGAWKRATAYVRSGGSWR